MGEIADSILQGEMCEICGVWLDDFLDSGEGAGFPRTCFLCSGHEEDLECIYPLEVIAPLTLSPIIEDISRKEADGTDQSR